MKKIKFILFSSFFSLLLALSSCNDFMDFPPAISYNVDSVFSKYSSAYRLLSDMYRFPIPLNFDTRYFGTGGTTTEPGTRMGGGSFASALTDEGQSFDVQQGYQVQRYYYGNVEPSTCASWNSAYKGEDDYEVKWRTIRKAYLILNNIDRVPDETFPTNQNIAPQVQKNRIKAECKIMIALVYFEMWKRYGGVPILNREFRADDDVSTFQIQRATLEETYTFISGLLNDVMTNYEGILPAKITVSDEFGRFPMAFAYSLKARLELYAASPLYNTNSPYSTALGDKSNLICFMNYDRERWKKAADAATAAINYCNNNGYLLIDNPANRENGMNYTVANIEYPNKGNTELIWGVIEAPYTPNWQSFTFIRGLASPYGFAANLVPINQIERYEKDTTVAGQYKSWDAQQTFNVPTIASGTSANDGGKIVAEASRTPYMGLDPRFYASIVYNGVPDYGRQPFVDMANAWVDNASGGAYYSNLNGTFSHGKQSTTILHYVRKFTRGYEFNETTMYPINIYMRMAELYLIRAEALNEYNSAPTQQVYDDLNKIRERSGMVNVLSGQTQSDMRKTIAHERNIEMFYEDQRWFDLRRTLMSETMIPVKIYKINIRKWYKKTNSPWPYKITYDKELYATRVWFNKWYMNPFPTVEVNKGYGLIQNPGW
jgi:starch-binding outer membrane protein, SusD/RagB family